MVALGEWIRRLTTEADRAMARNDLAWLIANTEGDFDEAVRLFVERASAASTCAK